MRDVRSVRATRRVTQQRLGVGTAMQNECVMPIRPSEDFERAAWLLGLGSLFGIATALARELGREGTITIKRALAVGPLGALAAFVAGTLWLEFGPASSEFMALAVASVGGFLGNTLYVLIQAWLERRANGANGANGSGGGAG